MNKNKFELSSLCKILAITSSIVGLFSFIMCCISIIPNVNNIAGKIIVPIQMLAVLAGAVIFAIYIIAFHKNGTYPMLVPTSIILVGVGLSLKPLYSLINLIVLTSNYGRHFDTSSLVWTTLSSMALPTIIAVLVIYSGYLFYKGKNGKFLAFLAFPVGYYVVETISAIAINTVGDLTQNQPANLSMYTIYTIAIFCVIPSFLIFGIMQNKDNVNDLKAETTKNEPSVADNTSDVENKLKSIQDSYANGIISEEEYHKLRQRILSNL